MRLFLALELSSHITAALDEALAPLRELEPALAWVPPGKCHLTLRFLGEAEEPALSGLRATMDEVAAAHGPFDMSLDGIGGFPSLRRARVLWAGVESQPQLELLHHDIELALALGGYELEGRPFRPHVTVARVRNALDVDRARALARAARRIAFSATQDVSAITLFDSVPAPSGARYRRVHTASLGGR